ncbi:MAG: tyrosine-type recombinase/integrase [Bacillota bacterium]
MKVQEYHDLEKLSDIADELPLVIKFFIEHKLDENLSPSSLLEYTRDYRIFFSWITPKLWPYVGSVSELTLQQFNDITREHVQQFADHLTLSRSLQYSSLSRKFHSLRSLFSFLHEKFENMGAPVLRRNVFSTFIMERPKTQLEVARQLQNKVLRLDEIHEFVNFVQEGVADLNNLQAQWFYKQNRDRDVSIVTLLLESGMLVSDLVNLDLDDINLQDGYIVVTRQQAKVRMSNRIVFGENAKYFLSKYMKVRTTTYTPQVGEQALFLAKPNGETHGKRISKRTVQVMVKKYASKFGASEVTVRQLSHSFGVQYAGRNNIRSMKQQLAQRNIESLEKYLILSSIID